MSVTGAHNQQAAAPERADGRLFVRLPQFRVHAATMHAQARGETLSQFVRRALDTTMAADRVRDEAAAVRRAFSGEVFLTVDPESVPSVASVPPGGTK